MCHMDCVCMCVCVSVYLCVRGVGWGGGGGRDTYHLGVRHWTEACDKNIGLDLSNHLYESSHKKRGVKEVTISMRVHTKKEVLKK